MNKESRLLRLGILGCGPISQIAHFDAAKKARNIELTAVCGLADDLRERMTTLHQPRFDYRDYDEMLANPLVEAVLIGVADQFHVPLARKAIAAGKHVLVEKPLGVTLEECEELRRALEQSNAGVQRVRTGRNAHEPESVNTIETTEGAGGTPVLRSPL